MYSYGASARATGKRGHGGRPYRPPPAARKEAPPPLKQCSCLLQCHVPEYLQPELPIRRHVTLGGPRQVQNHERHLRANYGVHLVVPGKKQSGPIAIAASTHEQAIPAMVWLLQQFCLEQEDNVNDNNNTSDNDVVEFPGCIQLNVKDTRDPGIAGTWRVLRPPATPDSTTSVSLLLDPYSNRPYFVFHGGHSNVHPSLTGGSMSILVYQIKSPTTPPTTTIIAVPEDRAVASSNDNHTTTTSTEMRLEELQTCLDNAIFAVGARDENPLQVFVDATCPDEQVTAFALGSRAQAQVVMEEIQQLRSLGEVQGDCRGANE